MQKLAELCIKRPVFATMLILMLVVLGLDAYRKLGVDFFPKVEFPIVTVTTTLRGASPEEVETQVTKPLEEVVNTIDGIEDLNSTSAEGLSRLTIQFVLEKQPEIAAQEVRDKISTVLGSLPKDVDAPVIERLATDAAPVINVVVSSRRDLRETTKIVDDSIKKNIESLYGVGQVKFVGDRKRQIQVWLDGNKLYSYGLNIDQVRGALASQNVEVPGGRVDQGNRELSLRTLGRVEKPKDFERIIVANNGGVPVRVSDIGGVFDGVEEPRSLARLDDREAVVLEVRKQAGTNTLEVIRAVKERVVALQKALPRDFEVAYTGDQSGFIQGSFEAVQEHLVLGGVLAGVIVLLFIRSWRSTLIAAVAIPTSIISTFTLINYMGFTLNQITMLALTLMVGIVIDDAIVVLENVFRFIEEKKMSPVEAAIKGTADIGLAVLATTLSLAIIFIPVALMGGIVGHFMSSFGYVAAFAIMVSLLVSFTMTPMLCSRFLTAKDGQGAGTKDTWLFKVTARPYRAMLRWSMSHRWVIVVISLLVMYSTGPLMGRIGKDFLPKEDQSEFEVNVRGPAGSSLQSTDAAMQQIAVEIAQLPGIRHQLTRIGSDLRRQVDRGSILVELVTPDHRKETQLQIMGMARERLRKFRDFTVSVNIPAVIQGSGPQADFQYILKGTDLNQLSAYVVTLKKKLASMPGVTDVDSSYEAGKPEVRVRINRDKASDLNVSVSSVATALRTLVGGDDQATTFREGDDRYDVQLRVKKDFRDSPGALNRLFVPSSSLGNVPVASVASLENAEGPTAIDRHNRQRQILVSASILKGQSLSTVIDAAEETIKEMDFPPSYSAKPQGGSRELAKAGTAYMFAMLLSIIAMYMILASQFESFVDPITILLSLPLSVPFALISLIAAGENFSIIYTSLGILVLFGIVKKNSILQIDHIKSLRREGYNRLDAIYKGCEDRLRPILMTTAALVAGMLPLAFGGGAGAGTRRTVAIVVIGGQTLCLLLTLLVTPVAYSLFDDLAHLRLWSRLGRMLGMRGATAALLILLAAPGVFAEDPQRVGIGMTQRKLSLHDAIELALKNNLEIEIERSTNAAAHANIKGALGPWDPTFRWQPGGEHRNTPAGSVLQGADGKLSESFVTQNFSFRQRTPWNGAALNLDFDNSRNTSSSPFQSLSPYLNSRLTLGFQQPLLRGRVIDRERAELRIRKKQADVSNLDLELRLIDVIGRVESAYWDLAAARQDANVKGDGVQLANEQLARNKRMIDSGSLAPIELSASAAELERRRDTWYQAVGVITEVENTLKTLIASGAGDDLWADAIIPSEERLAEDPTWDDYREVVKQAVAARAEIRQVRERQEANLIQKTLGADQLKPRANLVASYSNAGLGGTVRAGDNPFTASNAALYQRLNELSTRAGLTQVAPPAAGGTPDFLVGSYGTALGNVFSGRYQSVQAGVALDFTFRNREAQSALEQTAIAEKGLKLEEQRTEQIVAAQVRNALQGIQTAKQRLLAALSGAKAAKEKLESEERLFQTGESTNFFVLTRQNEFLDSRRREVAAQLDLNKAIARLEQAAGKTLENHNVRLR